VAASEDLQCITDQARAAEILHPLRLEILRLASEPVSASELAPLLKLSRQRVNYHVRRLATEGFLRRAGQRRRRNMVEQRYIVSARAFLLSPDLLGAVGADWRRVGNPQSAEYLLALGCQMESDLIRVWREPQRSGTRTATQALKSQFRFENAQQRERFSRALEEAVVRVVSEHTSPNLRSDGTAAPGRPYRLVIGCYPYLPKESVTSGAVEV